MSIYGKGAPKKWKSNDGYNHLPERAGEYKIFYIFEEFTKEQCAYVGFTGNIRARIKQHNSKKYIDKCCYVSYQEIDVDKITKQGINKDDVIKIIREHERETIVRLNPTDTKHSGGGGRAPNLGYMEKQLNILADKEENTIEASFVDKVKSLMSNMIASVKKHDFLPKKERIK